MELTKEQTYKHLYEVSKRNIFKSRFRVTTKFKWRCLRCMKIIYVRYNNCTLKNSIFCDNCKTKNTTNPNVIQYQYLRKLKEEQLKFVDNYICEYIDKQ